MVELLAPAGSLEKLKMAIIYGADAVYLGGEHFGLREAAENFTPKEMAEGIGFVHNYGKKAYITANIIPHNNDIDEIYTYIKEIEALNVDGIIISDLGVFSIIKEVAPKMEIHISTQANNTNYKTINFWHKLGAKRIIVARDLSLNEIKEIRQKSNPEIDIEAFVHGAMCMSYSGRCLLSNYMTGRDSNGGHCAHPCRWKYYLMEEKREGQFFPVYENERGTFIFNSKDLCMIEYIPQLIEAGITSLKIEGRVKSAYYVATIVNAYRQAIDSYYKNIKFDSRLLEETLKVSHREYSTGFYFGKPNSEGQIYTTSSYIRDYDIVGMVINYNEENHIATVEQRNRFYKSDTVEVIQPGGKIFSQTVDFLQNSEGEDINVAPHPQMILKMNMKEPVVKDSIVRKQK